MIVQNDLSELLKLLQVPPELLNVSRKVLEGARVSREEGLLLFEKAGLGLLGMLSNLVRERMNGDETYFVRNYHIEPTNLCIHDCLFCSYSAKATGYSWKLEDEEMLRMVGDLGPEVHELHIVGGVPRDLDVRRYAQLVRSVKKIRPDLHVKAFSAVELDYMISHAGMSLERGLLLLKEAGLDSIPGGGAEIFDEGLRARICPHKTSSAAWLEIHAAAHRLGIPSNATILYGHIENYHHRVDHLDRLRTLQDNFPGFSAFIPLKFRRMNNQMSGIKEATTIEDLKNYAVSRIYLDNFRHIKAYWPALGKQVAQLSLSFGVDDLDGTIQDSTKIYSLAGAEETNPSMTAEEMKDLILGAGRIPVERDALYNPVNPLNEE